MDSNTANGTHKMTHSESGKLGWIASQRGRNAATNARLEQYLLNPATCTNCGDALEYAKRSNKFCSHSCSAKYSNVRKESKMGACIMCGHPLKTNSTKFCSQQCHIDHKWKLKVAAIESGEYTRGDYNEGGGRRTIKKYLIYKRGCRCEICGITKWQGVDVPLVCDHIDGNPNNNSISNYRLVCGNCDMQLPTYKNKNMGSGREYRRINKKTTPV